MATKKKAAKKKSAKKPVRKAVRRAPAALPLPPVLAEPAPKRNGWLLALMIVGLLGAVLWRSQRHGHMHEEGAMPEGRSPMAELDKGEAPKPKPKPTVRREAAGETGEPSLSFDRSAEKALSVRCWRPAGGRASLEIFGPRNQKLRSIQSNDGEAGWQTLRWDGKDEAGKAVPVGLYYLRPSANGLQQVRDVWVKG